MLKRTKRAIFALTGYAVGMFSTYLLVNATLGERRGEDVFALHDHPYQYLVDIVGGLACAGIGYGLSTIGNGEPGLVGFSPQLDSSAFIDEQGPGAHMESPGSSPMFTSISGPDRRVQLNVPSILKASPSSSLALASSSVGSEEGAPRLTISPEDDLREEGFGLHSSSSLYNQSSSPSPSSLP